MSLQSDATSPAPAAPTPVLQEGGSQRAGYLYHYRGQRLCLFLDYAAESGWRDEKSQPKGVSA